MSSRRSLYGCLVGGEGEKYDADDDEDEGDDPG